MSEDIQLVNEGGKWVGRDPETGEKVPVPFEAVETEEVNSVRHVSQDEDLVDILGSVGPSTKLVLEPDATYQVDGEMAVEDDNITIEGAGMESTRIEFSAETGDNMLLVGQTDSANYFRIRNLTLDCSKQTEPDDLGVGSGDEDKSPGNAIFFDNEGGVGLTNPIVENVRIKNTANEAVAFFGRTINERSRDFYGLVKGCEIINPRYRGIHPHWDHTIAAVNNTFRDCTQLYDALIRHSAIISGNRFIRCTPPNDDSYTSALILGSDLASVITNNTIENCGNADQGDILNGDAGIVSWRGDKDWVANNTFIDNTLSVCLSTTMLGGDWGGVGRFVNNIISENDGGGIFVDKDNSMVAGNYLHDVHVETNDDRQGLIRLGDAAEGILIRQNYVVGGSGNMPVIEDLDGQNNYIEYNYFDTDGYPEFIETPDESIVRNNTIVGGDNTRSAVMIGGGDDQTIPDEQWTKIGFHSTEYEDELVAESSTSDDSVTVKNPGIYSISAILRFRGDESWSTGDRIFAGITINGGEPDKRVQFNKVGTEDESIVIPSTEINLNPGDVVDIRVFHEGGEDQDLATSTTFQQFSVRQVA